MPASRKTRNSSTSSQPITTKKRKPKSRVGGKYNPRRNNYGIYIYRVVKEGMIICLLCTFKIYKNIDYNLKYLYESI